MFPLSRCTSSASKRAQSSASVALHRFGFYASSFSAFKSVRKRIPNLPHAGGPRRQHRSRPRRRPGPPALPLQDGAWPLPGGRPPSSPSSSSSSLSPPTGSVGPHGTRLIGLLGRSACAGGGFLATFDSRRRRLVFCLKHHQRDS